MNKISCGVARDLLPLVLDGVACEESKSLVEEHLKECAECQSLASGTPCEAPSPDDKKILKKIKNRLYYWALAIVLLGTVLGVSLSGGMAMLYNILLFPAIGAVAFLGFDKRAYLTPLILGAFSYIWLFVFYWMENGFFSLSLFSMPSFLTVIYSFLALLGIVVAELLKFALHSKPKGTPE